MSCVCSECESKLLDCYPLKLRQTIVDNIAEIKFRNKTWDYDINELWKELNIVLRLPWGDLRCFYGNIYPSKEAVTLIANTFKNKKILSVGSGIGIWEYCLLRSGIDIVATDIEIWPITLIETKEIDAAEAVKTIPHDVLMIVWSDRTEYDIRALKEFKGNHLIVIGEDERRLRGDIGSEAFHNELKKWTIIHSMKFYSDNSCGCYAEMRIYKFL